MQGAAQTWCGLLVLITAGTGHQIANRVTWHFILVEDSVYLFCDRHLDAVSPGETKRGGCRKDTFGDFATHPGEDGVELVSTAEFNADGAISGELSCAGKDEVTDTGEPGEGLATATTGDGEPCHLCDSASDQRCGGVMTEVETFDHSRCQCNDIL